MATLLVGTRKGTFLVEKRDGAWSARLSGHKGTGVNFVAKDPHTGRLWALGARRGPPLVVRLRRR